MKNKPNNKYLNYLKQQGIEYGNQIKEFNDNITSFFEKLGIDNILFELSDDKKSFASWIQKDYDRAIADFFNELYNNVDFTTYRLKQFKNIEKIFISKHFISLLRDKQVEKIIANLFHLENIKQYRNLAKVLKYAEKQVEKQKFHPNPIGKIHLSPETSLKSPSKIDTLFKRIEQSGGEKIAANVRNIFYAELTELLTVRKEYGKLLLRLHQYLKMYNMGLVQELEYKKIHIKSLKQSSSNITKIFDPKTGSFTEIKDKEKSLKYTMFTFIHKDGQKGSAYNEIIKEMQESPNSSYNKSSKGEKIALAKIEKISIASSNLHTFHDFLKKRAKDKKMVHVDFDSAIKSFFILGTNFNKHPQKYATALGNYYDKLSSTIKKEINNILSEYKTDIPDNNYIPSNRILREWEDPEIPLKGIRILFITIPEFIIAESLNFIEIKDLVGGFIAPVTNVELDIRDKLMQDMEKSPYIQKLIKKRSRAIGEIQYAFNQCCEDIFLLPGNRSIALNLLITRAIKDNNVDSKFFKGIREKRTETNNKKKESKMIEQKKVFIDEQWEKINILSHKDRQELFGENYNTEDINKHIMRNLEIVYPSEEYTPQGTNKSELQMVVDSIKKAVLDFIDKLNEINQRYEVTGAYNDMQITRTIPKKEKK